MANSEPGTSTSDTSGATNTSYKSGGLYQVLLSFRGLDTRRGFTNSLYHALVDAGIRVFIDDEELPLGERISDELEQAIDDSRLYIPIFSKSYASSHWCLRELAKMVENKSKDGKKIILPIFYDVKPDDVKLKTSLYSETISNLEQDQKKFNSEEVGKWRQALEEVGRCKGWEWKMRKGDGDLIKLVVHEVLVKLETRQRRVSEDLVGMEDHIIAINNLLDIDPHGVRLLMIYGMGGIGKTTLAKKIFNQLCPSFGKNCSFLDDVRNTAETKDSVELQKGLLFDISCAEEITKIDKGIERIRDTIYNKEVLIVLDDVDAAKQIQDLVEVNSLCPGSIILVTTRDKGILDTREFKDKFKSYEMMPLSNKDSLTLFCKHAFGDDSPPSAEYYPFLEMIIRKLGGLPLALEVIGSSLFGVKEKVIWKERADMLKNTPHKDVMGQLKISYDALESTHQKIFLDVAYFFVGCDKNCPTAMWQDCEFYPNDAIDVLTKRCMMKVLPDGKFWMHDQLRDLGRNIAKDERASLWGKYDIIRELKRAKDEERVEAFTFSALRQDGLTVTSEQIKRFPSIRFLSLHEIECQGDFTGCLPELRWISLSYGYIVDDKGKMNRRLEATNLLHLENAVAVSLKGLQFADDAFESLIKGARKLKALAIRGNFLIRGTPTFSKDSVLASLILDHSGFREIDCSIGGLQHLIFLSIATCFYLKKLPEQIGELRNLRQLVVKSCHQLIELPDSVSKLELLAILDVSDTRIERLPPSIGRLPSLWFLDVSGTPIAEMPGTTSQFRQLRTLKMHGCDKIQELPKLPISLTTLVVTSKSLRTLPDFSYLTNLVELVLSDGNHVEGWSSIIQTCELAWIGRLPKLSKLSLQFPTLRAPTTELGSLYRLKELDLWGLDMPTFEQIPSDLVVLKLCDARGKQVHLDGLPQMEKETDTRGRGEQVHMDGLLGCEELQAPELTDQRRGAFIFPGSQKRLKKFHLSGFPEVRDIQFVSTLESLEEFSVEECSSLKSLGGLSFLKNLKRLVIKSCESLRVIEGIDKLEFLHWLEIDRCRSMEMIFDASSSKIPNNCQICITFCGKLPNSGCFISGWNIYQKKILNGAKQASDTEMETTDSESECQNERNQVGGRTLLSAKCTPMANLETGNSTSDTSGGQDQVFLSFRGLDTHRGFTNSLYHALIDVGIRVFIDDEDLRLGENISDKVEQAIDDSRLYIPIFSKSYASSHWCLNELAKMVENKSKNMKKSILPIFYNVKPDDVKLKTSLYSEAILKLEHDQKRKFNSEEVKKWRQALQEVGHYTGWYWEPWKGDGDLIKSVVHVVLVNLEPRQRQVTKNLVGMQGDIEAINTLLDNKSRGVQIILIHGMGGIGKTTLAKIIFNQRSPYFGNNCSFLDDVRITAETKGLVELQKRLLSDVSRAEVAGRITNIDEGINNIVETICSKEVLIVLDDVAAANQIHCLIGVKSLRAGTIILVTSRDGSILDTSEFEKFTFKFQMTKLNDEDALELFCKYAFNENSPPDSYYSLSTDIVFAVRSLPLALEVIGSSLFGQEKKEIWQERLDSLMDKHGLRNILKVSYDALGKNHQRIFFDIACFFVGENKTKPMYMWEDCEFRPNDAIDILTKRCMIKVLDDGAFWMHDELIQLGRAIAREEHSILWWNEADIICELQKTKDEERVAVVGALSLSAWRQDGIAVTSEQIKRFPNIRILWLGGIDCQGDFTGCLPELRWISLSYRYTAYDEGEMNRRLEATNLLHLENAVVVYLHGLQFADDALESLIMGARKLKDLAIHGNFLIRGTPTFSKDSVLEKLTFDHSGFTEIDCSIGRLQHLTKLSFEHCYRLKKLPEQIGELRNLRHLSLKSCLGLIELPDSVSELESLTTLDVSLTKIEKLPHSIGGLPRLSFLDVSHAPIAEMPRTTSQFRQLRTLKMIGFDKIEELPMLPTSLTTLELTSRSLRTLPDLSYLTNLIELQLSDGNDVEGRSGKIQNGGLSWVGRLSKLSKLRFRFPTVRAPTTELSSLWRLKELTLQGVDLPTFEQIPANLIVLELYGAPGKRVHRDGVPQLEKETDTRGKRAITDELLECVELQAPELADHPGGAFVFPRFQKTLRKFHLSGFPETHDIRFESTFESLEEFNIEECSSLKSLSGLSFLENLKRLKIQSCERLRVIEGIDKLEFLWHLQIGGCRSMEMIFDASSSKIPNNCKICIRHCGELPGSRHFRSWEDYRNILNGTKQASDSETDFDMDSETDFDMASEMERRDSETGTGDPLLMRYCQCWDFVRKIFSR